MSNKRQRQQLKRKQKQKRQRRKRGREEGPPFALPADNFGVPEWTLFDDPENRSVWPAGVPLPTAVYPSNGEFQRDFAIFNDQVRGRSMFMMIGDSVDLAPWIYTFRMAMATQYDDPALLSTRTQVITACYHALKMGSMASGERRGDVQAITDVLFADLAA